MPPVGALRRQLLQHVLLVGLGLQVEEARSAAVRVAEGLAPNARCQRLPMILVVGVVALKLLSAHSVSK